jgi:hypothetical protein
MPLVPAPWRTAAMTLPIAEAAGNASAERHEPRLGGEQAQRGAAVQDI